MMKNKKNIDAGKLVGYFLDNKAFFILIIFVILMTAIKPIFLSPGNMVNILRQVCVSAILGVGYTLVLATGGFDLSIGTMMGLSGIILAMTSKVLPLPVAFLVGILFGVFLGGLNATLINVFDLPAFMVTLSTQTIFRGASYLITKMVPVGNLSDSFLFFGQGYIWKIPTSVYVMAIMTIIMCVIFYKTTFGRQGLCTGGNAEAARVCGVNVKRNKLFVYMIMGAYAAVAGIVLTARAGSAQVSAGQGMEMDTIAAVVIGGTAMHGGKGNIIGTIIGCVLVGSVVNGLNLMGIDPNWQVVAKGALILLAIILDRICADIVANVRMKQQLAKEQ